MGGCRCSYRDCKARSDGQTHMFHFPVFDKVRCHLWIKNAHKPNFLNLKVSQLKNRVICQHHFRNDNFMNFKKDKLKHDAVPTEDGPFCIPDLSQPVILIENDDPIIPINADDIENEKLDSMEKRAHRSVKYGDFLISDATELFNASIDNQATLKKISTDTKNMEFYNDNLDLQHKLKNNDNHKYTINYLNEDNTETKDKTSNLTKNTPIPSIISIEFDEPTKINCDNSFHNSQTNKTLSNTNLDAPKRSNMNPNKMVKIISQKTISEPVLVEGRLEPVSPSMIIQKPKRLKRNLTYEVDIKPIVIQEDSEKVQANVEQKHPEVVFDHILPIEYVPTPFESDVVNQSSQTPSAIQHANMIQYEPLQTLNYNNIEKNKNSNTSTIDISQLPIEIFMEDMQRSAEQDVNRAEPAFKSAQKPILTPTSTPVYKSLLKSKITPEKLAAIEQKRKFNLKMRDVITSCLDNLEESNDDIVKKIAEQKKQTKQGPLMKQNEKRVMFLKEHNPPVANQDSIIDFLDKRLQKLETTLLNKIVHNTQRINELKRAIKPSSHSKHANTQTYIKDMCEESQKHFLYKEISKFLSPNANIKVFQELFIDKTKEDEFDIPTPRKLRRRR